MSQEVTTGLFALGGVLIGGSLNVGTSLLLTKIEARRGKDAALRLVADELLQLGGACDVAYDSIADKDTMPVGLVRGGHSWSTAQWEANKTLLADTLSDEQWTAIAKAYREVEYVQRVLLNVEKAQLPAATLTQLKTAVRALAVKALKSLGEVEDMLPGTVKLGRQRDSLTVA